MIHSDYSLTELYNNDNPIRTNEHLVFLFNVHHMFAHSATCVNEYLNISI